MKTIFTCLICIVLTTAGSLWLINRYVRVERPAAPVAAASAPAASRPVSPAPASASSSEPSSAPAPAEAEPAGEHLAVAYDKLADDMADVTRALDRFNGMLGRQTERLRSAKADPAVDARP